VRQDIEKLSLAAYLCELLAQLATQNENANDFLRLMLNSLYLLEKDKRTVDFIKPLFELRCLSIAGYSRIW
jgi:DNA repair protein RecO (recombination protein O)